MLRAICLTVANEGRLLLRDPIAFFMLLFAPVVIISVAGYSLGSLYGSGARTFVIPVVDHDHGPVAAAIVTALRDEHSINLELLDDSSEARRIVNSRDLTPFALVIPAGTSVALARGRGPRLILYADPVRRVEVNALEIRIGELCRKVVERARSEAQAQLDQTLAKITDEARQLSAEIAQARTNERSRLRLALAELRRSIQQQTAAAVKHAGDQATQAIELEQDRLWAQVQSQLSVRQAALAHLQDYLVQVQSSARAFDQWIAKLRQLAGAHATDIPSPPVFPPTPSSQELSVITRPITPPQLDRQALRLVVKPISIALPAIASPAVFDLPGEVARLTALSTVVLPGSLSFVERPAGDDEANTVNAFDQYVPGFGVTFLLIGMMLGIALTLFDERDWGTLKRLQVSGAPLTGLLMGKLFARFVVGTVQMVLLFAVGWALFGISLGRQPLALLMPIVGISFAAGALGLVIASIAQAHDSVMPLGTVVSISMAAIGGCWWPLDFEPAWMRAFARWLPTTWTMEAFNDLMIRNLPMSSALWPFVATMALGVVFLAIGIFRLVTHE